MGNYILRRLIMVIPTLVGLTLLIFLLLRVGIETDTVDIIAAQYTAQDPEYAEQLREEFGLSASLPRQYVNWVVNLLQGDLGKSFYTQRSVVSELGDRLPVSIDLGLGALFLTVIIAIPIGVLSAARQDSMFDYALRGSAIFMYALPGFWAATLVLVFGSYWFGWAPHLNYKQLWEDPVAHLDQLWPPMVLLALAPIGSMVRLVRTQVLEVIRQDYVRTAKAKGLASSRVYTQHVLRNSMLPIVTLIGLQLPRVVAGTVIFEQIFGLPGMGSYLLSAISRLDYPVIQSVNLVFGLTLVLVNLMVDVSYGWFDPRIRPH